MGRLDDKVAIVTGSGSGLGKQFARRLGHEGARVAICDYRESRLQSAREELEGEGIDLVAVPCDVSKPEDLQALVDATVKRFGTVDVLVNNAHTITTLCNFFEQDIETLDLELHSSLYATWRMMKLCFPYMKESGGSIINLGSRAGVEGSVNHAAYAASKEAIRGLSRVVAREWGQYNIRVNVVTPAGWTDNMDKGVQELKPEIKAWVEKHSLANAFHRHGDPYADVAPVVAFLASDDSRWLTGQTLHTEGGLWMSA